MRGNAMSPLRVKMQYVVSVEMASAVFGGAAVQGFELPARQRTPAAIFATHEGDPQSEWCRRHVCPCYRSACLARCARALPIYGRVRGAHVFSPSTLRLQRVLPRGFRAVLMIEIRFESSKARTGAGGRQARPVGERVVVMLPCPCTLE